MAISIITGFDVTSALPADLKNILASSSSLTAISSSWRYNGMSVYCQTEQQQWQLIGGTSDANWVLLSKNGLPLTASSLTGLNIVSTASISQTLGTPTAVATLPTGSYFSVFFDYAAASGSNVRTGTVFGAWVAGSISYTEIANVDVGNTNDVTMSLGLNGPNVQLSASVNTSVWTIRTLGRFL